jgi:UDP-2,4-diacetamido-2,4,6-trideoxy-beta-L-altropyranose hydrolase
MRAIAIGQRWKDLGGEVVCVSHRHPPAIDKRLRSEGFSIRFIGAPPGSEGDATETAGTAASIQAGWVVVDGYVFGGEYQKILKEQGCRVLFIDDYGHAEHYSADIVLNQNLSAREEMYIHRDPGTRLLLGPRYALIRREFGEKRRPVREIGEKVGRLLVSLGGSDPENVTLTVIRALEHLGQSAPHALVVVGEANLHRDDIEAALKVVPDHTCICGGDDMAALMATADAAISGAGSTTGELLFMGVPFLALILAENQAEVAQALGSRGLAWNLGEARCLSPGNLAMVLRKFLSSPKIRAELSDKGRNVVDGFGTARIVMHLYGDPLWLRMAEGRDCDQIWSWANDPVVREASFHPEPIPLADHEVWFRGKLVDARSLIFIAMNHEDQPVGQIRFDIRGDEAEVDYSIDGRFRGQGLGTHLLRAGLGELHRKSGVRVVRGLVKTGNLPSIRSFEEAGFLLKGKRKIRGSETIEFIREL